LPFYGEDEEVVVPCSYLLPNDAWHWYWGGGNLGMPHGTTHAKLP
jgi:hypothetical protein